MFENVKEYKNTGVNWAKSQAQIMQLLESRDIEETRFTNLSYETMKRAGLGMLDGTSAIMLEFFRPTELSDGVAGTIPIRIIIPNIPANEQKKNQAYRVLYWYLKSKFVGVETGLFEFEQEFMAHIALGKGHGIGTMWQAFKTKMLPKIISGESSDIKMLEPPEKK